MKDSAPRERLPLWAEALLTFWVLLVAVVFFGPIVLSWAGAERAGALLGAWTQPASLVYLVMVILAVIGAALRFLRRSEKTPEPKERK